MTDDAFNLCSMVTVIFTSMAAVKEKVNELLNNSKHRQFEEKTACTINER